LFVCPEKHYIFSLFNLSVLYFSLFVNFFPIPSFLLHLLVTVKNAHRKTQPIASQSSHKKHIVSCTFDNCFREIKIPKQDPTSPYPVSPSPDPAQREWREQEGKLLGERGMKTGDEEQISDRRERTERERTGEWWWCPAPWICDGVLLLQRTGEWLETTEKERSMIGERERTVRRENPGEWGDFRNWMRGIRGEWEGNLRNRMRETDWEGHEKPNDRNGLTGMRNRMRWEW